MKESREKKLLKSINNSAEVIVYGFLAVALLILSVFAFNFAGSSFSSSMDNGGKQEIILEDSSTL